MNRFIPMTCPACKGKLKITDEIEQFVCTYCGNEFIVNRGDGIISLKPLEAKLQKIQQGTDRMASELAIARLKEEIAEIKRNIILRKHALLEKGDNIVSRLSLESMTIAEMRGVIAKYERILRLNDSGWRKTVFNKSNQRDREMITQLEAIILLEEELQRKKAQLRSHQQFVES